MRSCIRRPYVDPTIKYSRWKNVAFDVSKNCVFLECVVVRFKIPLVFFLCWIELNWIEFNVQIKSMERMIIDFNPYEKPSCLPHEPFLNFELKVLEWRGISATTATN